MFAPSFPDIHRLARRRPAFAVLLAVAVAATPVAAQTPPVVRVTGVTPDPGSVLASGQNLYARVTYESDRPLRLQAAGYLGSVKQSELATNPSPVFPAGSGEAVVWVFGQPGARIDELRAGVYDADWKPLFDVPVPAQAEWRLGVPEAAQAPWAAAMAAGQQRAVNEAMQAEPEPASIGGRLWHAFAMLLMPLAFLCTPGYPLLQLYAFWKLRGPVRLISATPLAFMLPIYGYSLHAFSQGSNLWPLYAVFVSPVAFAMTLAVVLVARKRMKAEA